MKSIPLQQIYQRLRKHVETLFIIVLGYVSLQIAFVFPSGDNINRIWSDAEGYYLYLPAVFIYQSFDEDVLPVLTPDRYQAREGGSLRFTRYTCGVAIMEMPFFLATHLVIKNGWFNTKHPTGYSKGYSDAIVMSAIFYCMMGLWLLMRYLQRFFSRKARLISILAIFLGTNLFYYSVGEGGMSHAYSFFLFSALIYLTPIVLARTHYGYLALMGFIMGLIFLIRPTNAVFFLFPLCYQLYDKESLTQRWQWFKAHLHQLWIIPVIAFLPIIPQLFYWHHLTGDWFFFSYGDENYFPYLTQPRMLRVLFDVRNGLLIYNPLLLLSLLGMAITSYHYQYHGPIISFIFILITYIFGSYAYWWFGGSFGQRSYIEYYAILIIPLAYVIDKILSLAPLFRGIWLTVVAALIWYSARLSFLYDWTWAQANWTWNALDKVLRKGVFIWPF